MGDLQADINPRAAAPELPVTASASCGHKGKGERRVGGAWRTEKRHAASTLLHAMQDEGMQAGGRAAANATVESKQIISEAERKEERRP
jgi:hypothetical protein